MTSKGNLYKVVAVLVTLSMLLQIFIVPAAWFSNGVNVAEAAAASATGQETADLQPSEGDALIGETGPTALDNPISITKVQSAFVPADAVSGKIDVTFTIFNNQPPTRFPDVGVSATVTDALEVFSTYDYFLDPNTIRNVVIADSWLSSGTFVGSNPQSDSEGDNYVVNLGDIPPGGSLTATLTIEVPGSVADFTELDAGAAVFGELQGRTVTAESAPIILAPNSFGSYLQWTPDADTHDQEMLRQAAILGADPIQFFELVRSLGYESYEGSLRGTLGTLWSESGNSLDQASLLIAMLRASGVPARYVRGTLNTTLAQQLILSMFPEPTQLVGQVPAGAETADPVNNPTLLSETQDHWWAQAYIGGDWINLDPTFAQAQPGDVFAAVDQTLEEVPNALRHKVALSVKVERMEPFDFSPADYAITYPLSATFNTVSVAGKPIMFSHLVNSTASGGVYVNYEHNYTPYFAIGKGLSNVIEGETYQDFLTNFPFGSSMVTGVWLIVEATEPNGNSNIYEREFIDLLGPALRQPSGVVSGNLERPDASQALFPPANFMQIHVVPQSRTPKSYLSSLYAQYTAVSPLAAQSTQEINSISPDDEVAYAAAVEKGLPVILESQRLGLDVVGTSYQALTTSPERELDSAELLVKSYPSEPKLLLLTQNVVSDTFSTSFELLNVRERALAYPGQTESAANTANMLRTIGDKIVEYELLEQYFTEPPTSGLTAVLEAANGDIGLALVTQNTRSVLDALPISAEAKGRINAAVLDGKAVFVPRQMVPVDGEMTIGWAEVDEAGNTRLVTEDGRFAFDYGVLVKAIGLKTTADFILIGIGVCSAIMAVGVFLLGIAAVTGGSASVGPCTASTGGLQKGNDPPLANQDNQNLVDLMIQPSLNEIVLAMGEAGKSAVAACDIPNSPGCQEVQDLVDPLLLGGSVLGPQSPLPSGWLGAPPVQAPESVITTAVSFPNTVAGSNLNVNATAGIAAVNGLSDADWSSSAAHAFAFDGLTATSAALYNSDGTLLATGTATATSPESAVIEGPNLSADISGSGSAGFYAGAASGLGSGSEWQNYTAALTAAQPHTVTLENAAVIVGGSTYTGSLYLVVDGTTTLNGSGPAGAANFAATTSLQTQNGGLMLGPASGTFQVNGQPVDISGGVAVGGYTSSMTVAEATADTDQITFNGTADFFTLALSSATSTTDPNTAVQFDAEVAANFSDVYTVTVDAPDGWAVSIDGSGQITAVPPLGAAPDDYAILVAIQSEDYPDLFASAVHIVTITAVEGMTMTVSEDGAITVPMGDMLNNDDSDYQGRGIERYGQINDGQTEVSGAAYTVVVTNTSTISHPFEMNVSGLPAGWLVLSGNEGQTDTTITLAPGETSMVGFYVVPTSSLLPSPGNGYPFVVTVTAIDNGALTDTDNLAFVMPAVPFPYLSLDVPARYVTAGTPAEFDLTITNVGNSPSAGFPVTLTVQSNIYASYGSVTRTLPAAPSDYNTPALVIGGSDVQSVSVNTTGAATGESYLLMAQSAAEGYQPITYGRIQIVGPNSGSIFEAADETAQACQLGEPGLSAALQNLAFLVNELEATCEAGDCSLSIRDEVVEALDTVAYYANVSSLVTADSDLTAIAADIATHTANVDLEADMAAISAAVSQLETEVCELSQHNPAVNWLPTYNAGLIGQLVSYTLDITNQGTVTTTYAVTVELPSGITTFNVNLAPGETDSTVYAVSGGALGLYDLTATARATSPDVLLLGLSDEANAALNVVDRFIQLTAVTADPAFVETGSSSTNLSIDVSNIANIAWSATAETRILAPGGGISYTADIPVNILIGNPSAYDLATIDTSGWASGLYTITVDLVDSDGDPIANGSGYGYLGVGQALGVSQSVEPTLVAPGTVTVTTVITTEVLAGSIISPPAPVVQPIQPRIWQIIEETAETETPVQPESGPEQSEPEQANDPASLPGIRPGASEESDVTISSSLILTTTGVTRTEQNDGGIAYIGAWTNFGMGRASGGIYYRADDPGDTAAFTFNGASVTLGLIGSSSSANVEVFIDGVSQGVIDLYRREDTPVSFTYDAFITGTHTISVTHIGVSNPYSFNDFVQLDYIDVWDGTTLPDGTFEQNSGRVFAVNWSNVNNGAASGGSYYSDGDATAWFPFSGDSVTYQAIAYNGGGVADVYIDGKWQTRLSLYNISTITSVLSFDGLGSGFHVMMVTTYQGNATVDAFTTPGTGPFYTPPTPSGFTRFEDDDPAMLYNGVPYTVTARTWTRSFSIINSEASGGQYIYSNTANDTVSLTFDGVWAAVGFATEDSGGMAEIYLDGVSQGTVDLYTNEDGVTSVAFDNLITGTHTISITVLNTANPLSNNTWVEVDYIDVWDGTPLPTGKVEQDDPRVLRGGDWTDFANVDASGGSYVEENFDGTIWFPFEGDSITYQALDYFRSQKVAIYIDEVFQDYYAIYTGQAPTITYSFDGLGAGLHVMKIRHYRSRATLDAFITPAIAPAPPPPTPTTFTRHEEDYPAIQYNGLPYTSTAASWDRTYNIFRASDGQYINTSTPGSTISIDFTGTWIGLGFVTDFRSGQAEVFIDGNSQGVIDLYTRDDDVASFAYGGLADTAHTLTLTLLPTKHPNSTGTNLMFDYYETWDGASTPAATYEETSPEVRLGDYFMAWDYISQPAASGGSYINNGFQHSSAAWFPFTGDSVTFLGLANTDGDRVRISVDGLLLGTFNLYNNVPVTRVYSFDGFGPGPHMMEVRHNRGESNIDAFIVPGLAPFYQTPVYTGVVRYEEDNPALVYNGLYNFTYRPQSWNLNTTTGQVSGRWHVSSSTVGNTVSLTFDGRWAAAGFRTRNETGQVELFIDGLSQGTFNLDNDAFDDVTVIPLGDLLTGTHTISASVVAGTVYFDYFEVWDGQPMSDEIVNLRRSEDVGRIHYSASLVDVEHPNGIEGNFMGTTLLNTNSNIWYTFVGDAFTFFGFSRNNTTFVDLYVDGVFIETIDVQYPYSEQPLAFHYSGFGPGPHIARIHNGSALRADAFQSNPAVPAPYAPTVEWYDTTPGGGSGAFGTPAGMLMGIAAGDVNGDGLVEIVAPSDTYTTGGFVNSVFIYRGDGLDTGDGDPILHRIDFTSTGIGLGRETVGSVALADLDDLPGAEIIIGSEEGMYAFKGDGSMLWFTDTYKALILNATPAIGNLDFDDAPEIVVNMDKDLVVYEADGSIAWSTAFTSALGTPLLADMNNDGRLDIIVYDGSGKVYLYDYNFGSPTLLWQTPLSSPVVTVRGGPAIADLDGDGFPEIAMTHDGAHTVLDKDGGIVWSTPLDPGAAGGVSIADIDGDLEPEIVTGIKYDDGTGIGRLYALNADGSILWEVPAYDSTSANSQSVLDVNGDGVYEIAWNGAETGFTIFNGADGSMLFNEPLADSLTGTEYPIFADVDQDGFAEVVIPTNNALVVLGQDGIWGESRPLWNQHTYHITNINDDMSVPFSEANSWDIHNTYRTQWPEDVVLPVYDVTLTHTVGITGVAVVSSTFSVPPTVSADPLYEWDYTQSWADVYITRTFESVLTGLQPGETRLVAQGTEVSYDLPSGTNYLTLPPLYVSVPHIISVEPLSLTTGVGGTAVFDVILDNPAAASETYTLTVAGLPDSWLTFPPTVPVGAGAQMTVSLTVQVPPDASPDSLPFNVFATNNGGGQDQAGAELIVIDGLDMSIAPDSQTTQTGTAVTYTLTISNYLAAAQTYTLTVNGAADVSLPVTVTVPAASSASLPVAASAAADGFYPFTISAENDSGADSDSAVLETIGDWAVGLALSPASTIGGPLTPAVFTVTVSNLGSLSDTYDLDVSLPAGWTYQFKVNGADINSLSLLPDLYNSADVLLFVTPPADTTPGSYNIDVSAQSQDVPSVNAIVSGTIQVQNRGVDISINPVSATMLPTDTGLWQVTITNTGSVADSYWLTTTGFIGPFSAFSANPVALNAGQSTTVQLTADNLDFALPNAYQFSVVAESQNNALIKNEAIADVTFENFEAVEVGWIPVSQTVTDTLSTTFLIVITNTGNIATVFDFNLTLPVSLTGQIGISQLSLPAHVAAAGLVTVQADGPGVYLIEGTADSTTSAATGSSTATLEVVFTNLPPSANAGGDKTADEGQTVNFNGAASDPEGQPLQILWDFGDGATTTGTLTPTHAYGDDGQFIVTLTITDAAGLTDSDTLIVTVNNVAPTVDAGLNQNAFEGDTISLDPATFTDPGGDDTHTATINWGDGTVESGTVNQAANTVSGSHIYEDNGSYTVTVTVADDDGGSDNDTFSVTVANVAPQVNAGNDQTADEGDTVSLDPATFTDPGGDDTHTATINWGDGAIEPGTVNQAANTVNGSHVYEDNGSYTVTVTVTDDDSGSDSDTFTITVNNVAPSVEAGADQNAVVGDTVSLDPATFTDPGTADTHTAEIDWGDGSVESGSVNQSAGTVSGDHAYTQAGTYTVTVTVIDDDGGQSSDTFTVVVTALDAYYLYMPVTLKAN